MKKKPATKRRRHPELALKIARAQLRAIAKYASGDVAVKAEEGPPKFVQCWPVFGRPVTQALDSTGQVWESVWRKATATEPEERWWERVSMTRKEKVVA